MILDIGHGAGSFAFSTAEAALAAGIKPHAISTDIHQISIAGPMFDLPTCLSKFLALGLDLREVIAMATEAPARILRYEDRGSLRVRARWPTSRCSASIRAASRSTTTPARHAPGRQLLRNVETIVGGRVVPTNYAIRVY